MNLSGKLAYSHCDTPRQAAKAWHEGEPVMIVTGSLQGCEIDKYDHRMLREMGATDLEIRVGSRTATITL